MSKIVKKVIEVNEGINGLVAYGMTGDVIRKYNISDLPDYDEPLTADGLTIKEFIKKAKEDGSNIQSVYQDGSVCDIRVDNGQLKAIIENHFFNDVDISTYRIKPEPKPEVVHYHNGGDDVKCGKDYSGLTRSNNISKVTCQKCLEVLKYDWIKPGAKCFLKRGDEFFLYKIERYAERGQIKIKPLEYSENAIFVMTYEILPVKYEMWVFSEIETMLPFNIREKDTNCVHTVCKSNLNTCKFSLLSHDKNKPIWYSEEGIEENFTQLNGTPCGNPVPDLDYYKQFER